MFVRIKTFDQRNGIPNYNLFQPQWVLGIKHILAVVTLNLLLGASYTAIHTMIGMCNIYYFF